jgi:uncharacterized protein with PIN domain
MAMTKRIKYDKSPERALEMLNMMDQERDCDTIFICPECDAELLIILDWKRAKALNKHPGVYCPKTPSHILRMFNVAKS